MRRMKDAVLSGRNGEIEETIKDCWPGEQSCTSDNRTSLGLRIYIFFPFIFFFFHISITSHSSSAPPEIRLKLGHKPTLLV